MKRLIALVLVAVGVMVAMAASPPPSSLKSGGTARRSVFVSGELGANNVFVGPVDWSIDPSRVMMDNGSIVSWPCTLSTNIIIHASVVRPPYGFPRGESYARSFIGTVNPYSSADVENPWIYWSNDGDTFSIPFTVDASSGDTTYAANPLVPDWKTYGAGNSDVSLALVDNDRAAVIWRTVNDFHPLLGGLLDADEADGDSVFLMYSTDLVNWSSRYGIWGIDGDSSGPGTSCMSPSLVVTPDEYRIYAVMGDTTGTGWGRAKGLYYVTASSYTGPFGLDTQLVHVVHENGDTLARDSVWHLAVGRFANLYTMDLFCGTASGRDASKYYFGVSTDGKTFTISNTHQLAADSSGFDSLNIYRGMGAFGIDQNGQLYRDLWYCGSAGGSPTEWRVGRTKQWFRNTRLAMDTIFLGTGETLTTITAAGTADSIGWDTDGDGSVDAVTYATGGVATTIKKGTNITISVAGDVATIASTGGGSFTFADSLDQVGPYIDTVTGVSIPVAEYANDADTSATELRAGLNTRVKTSGDGLTGDLDFSNGHGISSTSGQLSIGNGFETDILLRSKAYAITGAPDSAEFYPIYRMWDTLSNIDSIYIPTIFNHGQVEIATSIRPASTWLFDYWTFASGGTSPLTFYQRLTAPSGGAVVADSGIFGSQVIAGDADIASEAEVATIIGATSDLDSTNITNGGVGIEDLNTGVLDSIRVGYTGGAADSDFVYLNTDSIASHTVDSPVVVNDSLVIALGLRAADDVTIAGDLDIGGSLTLGSGTVGAIQTDTVIGDSLGVFKKLAVGTPGSLVGTFSQTDGTDGQVLTTDGAGAWGWEDALAASVAYGILRPFFSTTFFDSTIDGTDTVVSIKAASIGATHLGTDAVSADELNATGVETELEGVLDLAALQGAVTDAQVPDNITVAVADSVNGIDVVYVDTIDGESADTIMVDHPIRMVGLLDAPLLRIGSNNFSSLTGSGLGFNSGNLVVSDIQSLHILNQTITKNDIDTTANFVVGGIYNTTSAVANNILITRAELGDTASAIRAAAGDSVAPFHAHEWWELSTVVGLGDAGTGRDSVFSRVGWWDRGNSRRWGVLGWMGNGDAGDRDTIGFAWTCPYAMTLDSIRVISAATGDSGVVAWTLYGPNQTNGDLMVCDSSYQTASTEWGTGALNNPLVSNVELTSAISAAAGESYMLQLILDYRADNDSTTVTCAIGGAR